LNSHTDNEGVVVDISDWKTCKNACITVKWCDGNINRYRYGLPENLNNDEVQPRLIYDLKVVKKRKAYQDIALVQSIPIDAIVEDIIKYELLRCMKENENKELLARHKFNLPEFFSINQLSLEEISEMHSKFNEMYNIATKKKNLLADNINSYRKIPWTPFSIIPKDVLAFILHFLFKDMHDSKSRNYDISIRILANLVHHAFGNFNTNDLADLEISYGIDSLMSKLSVFSKDSSVIKFNELSSELKFMGGKKSDFKLIKNESI